MPTGCRYAESFAEMRALPIIREPLDVARFTVTMKVWALSL